MQTKSNSTQRRPREQAVKDGSFITMNVFPDPEKEGYPVAITREVWTRCIEGPSDGDLDPNCRAGLFTHRFADVFHTIQMIVRYGWIGREKPEFVFPAPDANYPRLVDKDEHGVCVRLVLGPDDDGKDCLTLMMDDEADPDPGPDIRGPEDRSPPSTPTVEDVAGNEVTETTACAGETEPADTRGTVFAKDDLIVAFTRRQAIEDGVLLDVSETAREAGFAVPVAVTAGVWSLCVSDPEGVSGQDDAGRF